MRSCSFETRSLPSLLAATHRGFTFHVAFPKSSIRPASGGFAHLCLARRSLGEGVSHTSPRLRSRAGGRVRQLLFDLRQNAFHLFFAEGAHGLGLDVSQ